MLCAFLFFINAVQAQKDLLTESEKSLKSEAFLKLFEGVNDIEAFFNAIKRSSNGNRSDINKVLKNELGFDISDLDKVRITNDSLNIGNIIKFNSKEIIVNKKTTIFALTNDKKQVVYLKDYGQFVILSKEKYSFTKAINAKLNNVLYAYNCVTQSIHYDVYNTNIKAIKSRVIFGENGNTTNNTAIGFTNNEDGAKLNVGFNFNLKKKHYFNIGIFTASQGGFLYSNGAWSDNIGAVITHNKIIGKTSQYYDKNNCMELKKKRKDSLDKLVSQFKILEKSYKASIKKMDTLKIENNSILKQERPLVYDELKKIKDNNKIIEELTQNIRAFEDIVLNTDKYIDSEIVEFDTRNNNLKGHFVKWVKTSLSVENQNIDIDSLSVFNNIEPVKNIPRLNAVFSYNVSRLKNNKLLNLQGFGKITVGSFLDAILNERTPLVAEQNNTVFVIDNENNQIGRYQDLKRTFWTGSFGGQFSFFITENFGFTGSASHSFALQNLDFVNYENRYTALAGFAFRKQDEKDKNKITFRILGGFEALAYNTKTWENTSIKISLGIPFKL